LLLLKENLISCQTLTGKQAFEREKEEGNLITEKKKKEAKGVQRNQFSNTVDHNF